MPRRLEWISVILFIVNFVIMIYGYSFYLNNQSLAQAATVISTATGVLMLVSVTFSIFGFRNLSQTALALGLIGLMISSVALGMQILDRISEYNNW